MIKIQGLSNLINKQNIDELKTEIDILKNEKHSKKNTISIGVQLLIFHYLGLIDKIDCSNTVKAKILKQIFKADGEENIRIWLSNIPSIGSDKFTPPFTENNLTETIKLLKNSGFNTEAQTAESDLQNKKGKK